MSAIVDCVRVGPPRPHALHVVRANDFVARLVGWLGHRAPPAGQALWLSPCSAVHTFGMRFPIDVLFVDGRCTVIHVVHALEPMRAARCRGACATIELRAGLAAALAVSVGMAVDVGADGQLSFRGTSAKHSSDGDA